MSSRGPIQTSIPLLTREEWVELYRAEAEALPTAQEWQAYFRSTLTGEALQRYEAAHPKKAWVVSTR